jgi:hypothetical protein
VTETLLARHAASDRVAYGARGEHTAADLLRDAAAVAQALPLKAADRPLALFGVRRDAYACSAALLGAWERGYELLVPAADTSREGFLRLAQRADVGAVLHDTASSAALPIARILASASPELRLSDTSCVLQGVIHLAAPETCPDGPMVRLTGSQLLSEAALLGRSLGLPERAAYASALLPSTRYAWAAGVFWPLLSGGALLRDHPHEITWAEQLARAVLIGAPAQLRMLTRAARPALERALHVVSLGAPLPAAAFAKLQDAGLAVSDVYATSTLGCLGWRSAADRPFRPLLEVFTQDARDQTLQVSAPHIAPVRGARINAIPTHDGGFLATGVGMQRAEWEERIAWLDGVHDAALLQIDPVAPRSGERHAVDQPQVLAPPQRRSGWFVTHSAEASSSSPSFPAPPQAYCVALSLEPDRAARDGKALQARVMAELPALEIVQWRSLQRRDELGTAASFSAGRCDLTRNSAGRHDRVSLLRVFDRNADTIPLSWDLTIELEQNTPERCVRCVRVPECYGYFNGHFPGYPLLPGAAQLSELVVPFVRTVQPELGRLTRMARLKFQERIVPNDLVEVSLRFAPDTADAVATERSVEFALRRGDSLCASGRLWFLRTHAEVS